MRLWPGELTLPDLAAGEARSLFYEIIEETTQEVLVGLFQDVFPYYGGGIRRVQDAPKPLMAALERWAVKFNLAAPWVYEQALSTLALWHEYPALTKQQPLTWGVINAGEPWWSPEERRTISLPVDWDPATETRTAALERLRGEFERLAEQALDEIEGQARARGWQSAEVKRNRAGDPLAHFRWLVDYQVRGWTAREIADKYLGDYLLGEDTILKGVKNTARLIGLELRSAHKGGRPKD